jgi:hypothetical protein
MLASDRKPPGLFGLGTLILAVLVMGLTALVTRNAFAYPTRCLRHCGRFTPVLDPRGWRPHPWLVWVALHTPRHSNRSALGRLFIPLFCHPHLFRSTSHKAWVLNAILMLLGSLRLWVLRTSSPGPSIPSVWSRRTGCWTTGFEAPNRIGPSSPGRLRKGHRFEHADTRHSFTLCWTPA